MNAGVVNSGVVSLRKTGRLSPIKKISISSESPFLKHIVSFRHFAYMIVKDDVELEFSLNFKLMDLSM